jgi:serine/threonine-protein kinase RsbW
VVWGYKVHSSERSYFHSGAGILTESTSKRSRMVLGSELASVEPVEAHAEKLAREAGFDEDTASQIAMIAREAVINAILHGNKKDPEKRVRVGFELTDEALKITVADEGEGLDPDTVPDPCAPENIMRSSGRGIFLMRAIMDEVHFHQLEPGTEIELVKYRAKIKKELQA